MKKTINFLLILVLIFQAMTISFATEVDQVSLSEINKYVKETYGLYSDYYTPSALGRSLNIIKSTNYEDSYLVYGSPFDLKMIWNSKTEQRYLGYTKEGGYFENPYFPWDAGWNSVTIDSQNFVYQPWENPVVKSKYGVMKNRFCNLDLLEKQIILGLTKVYGGKKGKDMVPPTVRKSDQANLPLYTSLSPTTKTPMGTAARWIDYTYVTQPPTYNTWGTGVAYIKNSSGNITYMTIPIAPFGITDKKVSDDFTFSTFSNYEINQSNPKYDFTFYIADFEGTETKEKFYVDLWHHMEVNWVNEIHKSFTLTLDASKSIDWYTYQMSATPVMAVIYRKDKQWERWKDDEGMHNDFWNGYEKVIGGEKYYYYNTYYYKSDGMRFVSGDDIEKIPEGNKLNWMNYLGFDDLTKMQQAIEK